MTPNYDQMSTEELIAMRDQLQGATQTQEEPPVAQQQTMQAPAEPNEFDSFSTDQLLAMKQQIKQEVPLVYLESRSNEIKNKSPLTFPERWAMSTLSKEDQKNTLRQKFNIVEELPNGKLVAGNDEASLAAVDPEGIFNDMLGDLADVGSTITTAAGQTLGALVGSAAGPGGMIVGGATGAGIGEAVNKFVAKQSGSKQTPDEVASDVAISSLFGALGEGAAIGLGKLAPVVAKNGSQAFNSIIKRNPLTKDAAINGLAQTLKIASNVNPNATKAVFKYGPDEVFNSFNSNNDNIETLAKSIVKDIQTHRTALGAEYRASLSGFGNSIDKPVVPMQTGTQQFVADLIDSGFMDHGLKLNKNLITDGTDLSIMQKVINNLGIRRGHTGIQFKPAISPKEAIQLKQQLASRFESLSNNGSRILSRLRQSISGELEAHANKAGNTRFIEANRKFSEFADSMDNLKEAGFNIDNPVGLEKFIDKFYNKTPGSISAIKAIDAQTPLPILENIEKFASAQEFSSVNPNIMRLGFVTGLLGVSFGDSPEEKYGAAALGLLAGSPAGNKLLLRAGFKLAKGAGLGSSLPKGVINGKMQKQILTSLLSQHSAAETKTTSRSQTSQPQQRSEQPRYS